MREFDTVDEISSFCKALSSHIRMEIFQLLMDRKELNLQEIATALGVTASAVTSHIKLMESSGVILVKNINGIKGTQKLCSVPTHQFLISVPSKRDVSQRHTLEIPIGSYVNYAAHPTCGLLTQNDIVGGFDNPIFFDDPKRSNAILIWLTKGFLEYRIPNYLQKTQRLTALSFSQELCSETAIYQDQWPSDIYFSINGVELGYWTAPKDYVIERGLYTPMWWPDSNSQYGLLVTVTVNENGSFINGEKTSDVKIRDLSLQPGIPFLYRISAPEKARHQGGLTLFGRSCGNYNQNINLIMQYSTGDRLKKALSSEDGGISGKTSLNPYKTNSQEQG